PTRTAAIYLKNKYLGMIGMLSHEELYSEKALRGNEIYVYELDLDVLIPEISKGVTAKSAPKFPAINRDLSLLIDAHITNDAIISNIKANAGKYLTDIKVIDVYEGSQIEAGKKSIAYSLTFRNEKETLTDEVVSLAIAEITH
ncbi:MAG: phenylalanine--tRNA ligase subunit beta, partial [Lactobacillus iners]|nr:phenylalanine--tRNA ligase subunit beta [Lactobacillus iners]